MPERRCFGDVLASVDEVAFESKVSGTICVYVVVKHCSGSCIESNKDAWCEGEPGDAGVDG